MYDLPGERFSTEPIILGAVVVTNRIDIVGNSSGIDWEVYFSEMAMYEAISDNRQLWLFRGKARPAFQEQWSARFGSGYCRAKTTKA